MKPSKPLEYPDDVDLDIGRHATSTQFGRLERFARDTASDIH